jgi:hypothetical protein
MSDVALTTQVAQLQAEFRQLQGQVNNALSTAQAAQAGVNTLQTQAPANTPTYQMEWTRLAPAVSLVTLSSSSPGTWTTTSVAAYVPASAVAVLLNIWGRNDGSPNDDDTEVDLRTGSGLQTIIAIKGRGLSGTYSDEQAATVEIPLSATRTFDYQVTPGHFAAGAIIVLGYR